MFSTYLRLNLHADDTYIEVIRRARRKIKKEARSDPAQRDARHRFYSRMMTYHRQSRELFREVVYGEINDA
ncbi:hypothetical protein EOE18_15395 [Novosphingobium umbonatum]|uniref:Uncharacterized protein n=1 Tax=Novosphingobium umbonatum TaxID=1908524 RepID=A0A3S2X1T5_9SPHN|nr:hypothetical protein [Novosphingobium umbonatum]RVU03505.1 hypothetical protein EOE18_15395 [Novosphingobium umbonatum]